MLDTNMNLLDDFLAGGGSAPEISEGKESKKPKKSKKASESGASGGGEMFEYWTPFSVLPSSGSAPMLRTEFKCRMEGSSMELTLRCTNVGPGPAAKFMFALPALPNGFSAGSNSSLSMLLCDAPLSPGATTEATVSLQVPQALEGTVKFTGSIT